MSKAISMLRAEHQVMGKLLELLGEQIDCFENTEPTDYELMKEIVDYFLTVPDLYHHPKEDLIFARMQRRGGSHLEGMHDLPSEHERGSERLHAFSRALISVMLDAEFPRDRFVQLARGFLDNEARHMQGEETEFFPAALEHLSDEDWAEIDERVERFKDPIIHGDRSSRFEVIQSRMVSEG